MSRRSEYLSAAAWGAFGVLVAVAAFRLDRLESLGINPWSVPGLLPGVVGVLIVLLALVLAVQAGGRRSPAGPPPPLDAGSTAGGEPAPTGHGDTGGSQVRTLVAGTMCVLFAGISLGHGLTFLVEGAAFIFLFITAFSLSGWRAQGQVVRGLATALLIAVAAAGLISWLFESVFLVRLP